MKTRKKAAKAYTKVSLSEYGAASGIHIKPSHKGLLHKNLGIPQGQPIPASKLKVKSTDSAAVKKRKVFAQNAKKWHHAQSGAELPNANSSAPRKIASTYQPITPALQGNPFYESNWNEGVGQGLSNQPVDLITNQQSMSTELQPNSFAGQINYPNHPNQHHSYDGRYGDYALGALMAVDALLPNQKPRHPIVHPGLGYSDHPYGTDSSALMDSGGWIKHAINPSHKGWCTPLSNPHCTGHRRALALRFKHGDLHKGEYGVKISESGYRMDSPDAGAQMLRIPSNDISMEGVAHPVYGEDEYGNGKMMYPGEHHQFHGNYVDEYPMAQSGAALPDSTHYFAFNPENTQMSPYMVDLHPQQVGVNAQGQPNMMYNYNSQLKQGMLTQEELNHYKQQFGYRPNTGGTFYANDVKRGFLPIEASKTKMQAGGQVDRMTPEQINYFNGFNDYVKNQGLQGSKKLNTGTLNETLYKQYNDSLKTANPLPLRQLTRMAQNEQHLQKTFDENFVQRKAPEKAAAVRNSSISPMDDFYGSETSKRYIPVAIRNDSVNGTPVRTTNLGFVPQSLNAPANTQYKKPIPQGVDVFKRAEGDTGYIDPTNDQWVSLYADGGCLNCGGKMKVYKQGGLLKNYYSKGSVHDMSDSEIQQLVDSGYKLKFV